MDFSEETIATLARRADFLVECVGVPCFPCAEGGDEARLEELEALERLVEKPECVGIVDGTIDWTCTVVVSLISCKEAA